MRKQLVKNFACSLLFSAGTPMILGGDEFMRTQNGNNNAYCQDNEISWFDWNEIGKHGDLILFFKKAIAFSREYPILQSRKFLAGVDDDGNRIPDISWFAPDGGSPKWDDPEARTLCYMLDGAESRSTAGDYQLFFVLNSDYKAYSVKLPVLDDKNWFRVIDTSLKSDEDFIETGDEVLIDPPSIYIANPRSTVVLISKNKQ